MNVEQMIEDGYRSYLIQCSESRMKFEAAHEESFTAGVRHAIAAMFPVVSVEELIPHREYWCLIKGESEFRLYESSKGRAMWRKNKAYDVMHFDEIRRCPTPDEMGVG